MLKKKEQYYPMEGSIIIKCYVTNKSKFKKVDIILEMIITPILRIENVLIKAHWSLVSLRDNMIVDFYEGNLIANARKQTDKLKQILDMFSTTVWMPLFLDTDIY